MFVALVAVAPSTASAATFRLLGSDGSTIREIESETGQTNFLASTGLADIVNGQFVVDSTNRVAYQLGGRSSFRLGTIDLSTGTSRSVPSNLYSLAIYNGMLLGSDGPQIRRIDPASGNAVIFASTGLSEIVNNQFKVDGANHRAYQIGGTRNGFQLSTINLLDGTSNLVPTSLVSLELYNGLLLGSNGSQILQIDPTTGSSTFFASTGLSEIVNGQFVVDSETDLAYQLGGDRNAFRLSTINLRDGSSRTVPIDLLDLSVYAIPEPSATALLLFGILPLCARRRSH